jgi:hypothetical protein
MVEKVNYRVLNKIENIEIRQYPDLLIAKIKNNFEDSGFSLLFRYISGENKTQKKIPMTAPVITSEKIKMTAPAISEGSYMAFVMPSSYSKETIPIPTNSLVKIETQPSKIFAVLRFGGYSKKIRVEKFKKKLLKDIKENKLKTKGNVFLMRYNSPFAPGFIRRNEVAIELVNYNK